MFKKLFTIATVACAMSFSYAQEAAAPQAPAKCECKGDASKCTCPEGKCTCCKKECKATKCEKAKKTDAKKAAVKKD